MKTINELKELETPGTPILLFDCVLLSGDVQRWSTHSISVNGNKYAGRILAHNLFDLKSSSDAVTDGISKVSITLANADHLLSPIERTIGWKGARLTVTLQFFDLVSGAATSDSSVIFSGIANPPDESREASLRLSFTNRLNLLRIYLPEVRVERRCPWIFPSTPEQRAEAVSGGDKGRWSPFYRCGYSPDQPGGTGNLNGSAPFTSCDYTRSSCIARGMFNSDANNAPTRRYGGIEFVPPSIIVRSYGEKGSHLSQTLDNQARYNDFVPLVYGTGWYQPPVIFARNDGNLTHMEVLLAAGQIAGVIQVLVNGFQIPVAVSGTNMTATGWYNVVSSGSRTGQFNLDFVDASKNPLGDPYGSLAVLSIVVPNRISDGTTVPDVQVLAQGFLLDRYDSSGAHTDQVFTNNPGWILLDILHRTGWTDDEIALPSFAAAAQHCDELVQTIDLHGNSTLVPRYQCNLILTTRRSAGDVVRGIRNGSALYLVFDSDGKLEVRLEDTLANQQPQRPDGSNSTEPLFSGWPAYEFGDNAFSGIARKPSGEPDLRVYSRASADTPNRYVVEFQDEFNEYQQDSLSLVDTQDFLTTGQDVTTTLTALGLPNFDQATRMAQLQLCKSTRGNTYIDLQTSIRAASLKPGDIITLTYAREGFDRQPFRIIRMSPDLNFRTAMITAQIHDDGWYTGAALSGTGTGRQPGFELGIPRPLTGSVLDQDGNAQFGVKETDIARTDGTSSINLQISFSAPKTPVLTQGPPPLVGLNPDISTTGGTLQGGQVYYYALSGMDGGGNEGLLSFVVRGTVPADTNTNQVTLKNLSFSSTTQSFNVYRGTTPATLLQIANAVAIAQTFTDTGLTAALVGPPDYNYDHANFYWRFELQPATQVDLHSPTSVGQSGLNMQVNDFAGAIARITKGTGAGQERVIASNTATVVNVATPWNVEPDTTSAFVIADSTWQFGATSPSSPISFEIPNREGMTIEISGRSANVLDQECSFELCPITPWRILGSSGTATDTDVPGIPTFGLSSDGQGTANVVSVGFQSFANTNTVSAGTLTLFLWDETNGLPGASLSAAIQSSDTSVVLTGATPQTGDVIQIESELMTVSGNNNGTYTVTRGAYGTTAADHVAALPCYLLERKTFIMPFPPGFFGSLASGDYSYPIVLPDVRIAAAALFMTNARGNSDPQVRAFTGTSDQGLRTLTGGQLTLQVEGILAIETNAVPPLPIENTQPVRDVYAIVEQPSTGQPIVLNVTQNGAVYCTLTIPTGEKISNLVSGLSLQPLQAQAQLGLDIVSVSQTSDTLPGADLTVTIRL